MLLERGRQNGFAELGRDPKSPVVLEAIKKGFQRSHKRPASRLHEKTKDSDCFQAHLIGNCASGAFVHQNEIGKDRPGKQQGGRFAGMQSDGTGWQVGWVCRSLDLDELRKFQTLKPRIFGCEPLEFPWDFGRCQDF